MTTTTTVASGGGSGGGGNEALVRFLDRLESVEMIRSVEDERRVAEWAKEVMPVLQLKQEEEMTNPGDHLERIDYYRLVLDGVLKRSAMRVEEESISQLFLVTGSLELTSQSLEALLVFNGQKDFQVKLQLLEQIFTHDSVIVAALVNGSESDDDNHKSNALSTINRDLAKDRFVTRLINLPTVIANFSSGAHLTTASFLEHYVKLIYRNILRAWLVVAELNQHHETHGRREKYSYDLLGKLLSKVIVNFNANRASVELEAFLKIICVICGHDKAIYQPAMTELMVKINNCAAIEAALICLLNKCPNWRDGVNSHQLLALSADWRFVVKQSIPLRSYVRNEGFPRSFVQFLSLCDGGERDEVGSTSAMKEILEELLNCWSKSGGGDRALDQHIFISRLIIFLILEIKLKDQMDETLASLVKQRIYNGMSAHLQSLDMNIRFVGMRMAEVVLNIMENVAEEDRLDFGTAKLSVDKEVEKMFAAFDLEEGERTKELNEEEILNGLEMEYKNYDKEKLNQVVAEKRESPKKVSKIIQEHLDSDDDELPIDDEDDLVPYDLSNDVSAEEVVAPKYLLDLKEVLVSSTDDKNNAEKFQVGVKGCAELIRNQLPLNDSKLGVELLSILITLSNKVYNENFGGQRFEGCVAVVEAIPKEAAGFLCEEFYTEPGQYAISTRVLMLEVLAEAARRLSALGQKEKVGELNKKSTIEYKKLSIKDAQLERKKEINKILTERLAEKTRRFASGGGHRGVDTTKGINRFHAVAGSFVFPLISGFGRKQILFQSRTHLKDDTTNILLLAFLRTLCTLTLSSENAPNIRRILQEELHLIVLLKFYAEERIQMAVLELVGCVMSVTPKQMMATDFLQSFLEIKAWLEDLVERNAFNPDMNKESRELAQRLLSFL